MAEHNQSGEPAGNDMQNSFAERYQRADENNKTRIAEQEKKLPRPTRKKAREYFDEWIVLRGELDSEDTKRLTAIRKGEKEPARLESWTLWTQEERNKLRADRVHYLEQQIVIHDANWVVKNWRKLAAAGAFTAIGTALKWLGENWDTLPKPWTLALDNPTASPWFFIILVFIGSLGLLVAFGRRT